MKNNNMLRLAITVIMMIGCNVKKELPKDVAYDDSGNKVVVAVPIIPPAPAPIIDTPKTKERAVQALPVAEVAKLMAETKASPDTCLEHKLNLRWQQLAIRLIDSARNRKIGRDSVLDIVKEIRANQSNTAKILTGYQQIIEKVGWYCLLICLISPAIQLIGYLFVKKRKQTIAA